MDSINEKAQSGSVMFAWEGLKNISPWSFPTLAGIPILHVGLSRYYGNTGCPGDCNHGDESAAAHTCSGECTRQHGAVITQLGQLYMFGDNSHGQLGLGDCEPRGHEPVLVNIAHGAAVVHVSCGATHTAVLTSSGEVYCWGDNRRHQCSESNDATISAPTQVNIVHMSAPCDHARSSISGDYTAKMLGVSCGDYHTVALSETGDLWTWGFGRALGLLTRNQSTGPRVVPFLQSRRVMSVTCGARHTIAIVECPVSKSSPRKQRTKSATVPPPDGVKRPDSPVRNGVQYHKYRPATCIRCKEEIYTYKETADACVICNKHTCPLGFQVKDRQLEKVGGQAKKVKGQADSALPKLTTETEIPDLLSEGDPSVVGVVPSGEVPWGRKNRPQDLDKIDATSDDSQSTSTSQTSPIPTIQLPPAPGSPFMQKMGNFFQMVSNQPAAVQEYMTNITSNVVSNIKTSINKIGLSTREEDEFMQRQLSPTPEQLRLFGPMELTDVQVEELPMNIPKSKSSDLRMEQSITPGVLRRKASLPHGLDVIRESDQSAYHNEVVYNTEVWSWGDNDSGQLGHGDTLDRSQPCQVVSLNDKCVIEVISGSHHNLALTALSQVYSWGRNSCGQLGHSKVVTATPLKVRTLGGAPVWSAAAGHEHSLLLADGQDFTPDVLYAGKQPCPADGQTSPDMDQFTYLRLPWKKMQLTDLSAGGSMCACVGAENLTNQMMTLQEFAATERAYHQQIEMIRTRFLREMVDAAESQNHEATRLLILLEGALTILCNMATVSHLELRSVVQHTLALKKIRLIAHWEALVSGFVHYMQCLGNLRVVHGLVLDTGMANLCNEMLRELGYRARVQGNSELDCLLLLELPLSRVTDYRRLLDKLSQDIPAFNPDHYILSQMSQTWEVLRQSINAERKLVDNTIAFWDTISSEYPDKLEKLRVTARRLYKQGVMLITEQRRKDRTFALFNDILVCFKKSTYNVYPLETLWVEVLPDSKKINNALVLTVPEDTFTVIAQDRGEWYCAICEAVTNLLEAKHQMTIPPQQGAMSAMAVPSVRQAVYDFIETPQYRGAKYEGCWRDGKIHGEGRMTWADGRNFIGRFKEGNFEYGMYAIPMEGSTPELQIGHWKDWKLHGNGEIRYASGDEFKGYFLDGKRFGHGVLTQEDNTIYIGEWTSDRRNGYGVEVQATEVYMGIWSDDQKHGGGVMVTLDDLYFEGNFSYNKMTGLGLLISDDAMCYEGQFSGGLFSLSGHGKITFPNGDYIEGRFQGSLTGGINVNGTLRKGLVDKDASIFSLDDYRHDVEHRAVCFGKLGVPADRKWADIFSECYHQLGCGLGQRVGEVSTDRVWSIMIAVVTDKVEVLDFLTQRELSQDSEGSRNRLSRRFGLVDDLTTKPCIDMAATLTHESYKLIKDYLDKAFDCPLHPLGKLISELIYAFTTTYDGRGLHQRLLHYAVEEVKSFVTRIYDVIRLLFPSLPDPDHNPEPLAPGGSTDDDVDGEDRETEDVYITAENLLHPLIMPELYPTLFNLYALYHAKDDDVYWLRLEKWHKKPDLAIMVYLGIESRYWRSDSMDFDAVDPDSPLWKFKGVNAFNNCYTQAVDTLQTISTAYSPIEKLTVLKETFYEITKCLGDGEMLGQDLLFPIFTFVVLRAKIRQLGAEIHFIEDLMESSLKTGELGHMITDLSASYHYIKNEDDRKSVSHHQ